MIKRPRRVPFALQGVLFVIGFIIGITLLSHMWPLYWSILQNDDYVFFGKASALAQKSWLPGKFLPGIDERFRLRFSLNGDDAEFLLYLPAEEISNLSEWFPLVLKEDGNLAESHVEVHGVRISEKRWIVTEMESSYGELPAEDLWNYHLRNAVLTIFWGLGFLGMGFFFLCSMIRKLVWKRR